MSIKLYNGFTIPILDDTTAVPVPPTGKITIFARDDQSVWMKRADGTEARISDD